MKIDITQLLCIFDELLPLSNELEGKYWFKSTREDGLIIRFIASLYESSVLINICNKSENYIASLQFNNCLEVKVLDEKRKLFEVLDTKCRCFISLLDGTVLEYK